MDLRVHTEILLPQNASYEILIALVLSIYVLGVIYGTKYTYKLMLKLKFSHNVAVYFNRKLIHVFAGGVVAFLIPTFFTSPTIPLALALISAIFTWLPHRSGRLMEWFQVPENMYEVNFCVAWGVVLFVSWLIFGTPIYGIVPILFMSIGDAATGITRNLMYRRRTKSWYGNLAMFLVCAPISLYYLGTWGLPIAAVASVIEHYEFNPIDDNVLITLTTFLGILILSNANLIPV